MIKLAKIVRYIEDVSKISGNSFLIELEEIEFIGDDGNTKSFKIAAIVPVSAERCAEADKTIDWDKKNFHLLICPEGLELRDK